MNLMRYSSVNQQTKIASVTFRKSVSSASLSSVPSWTVFLTQQKKNVFSLHQTCLLWHSGIQELLRRLGKTQRWEERKSWWSSGSETIRAWRKLAEVSIYQRRFGWVSILEQSPDLSSYPRTANSLEWIRLDTIYVLYIHIYIIYSMRMNCRMKHIAPTWVSRSDLSSEGNSQVALCKV